MSNDVIFKIYRHCISTQNYNTSLYVSIYAAGLVNVVLLCRENSLLRQHSYNDAAYLRLTQVCATLQNIEHANASPLLHQSHNKDMCFYTYLCILVSLIVYMCIGRVIKAHTPDSQLAILYATSKMDIWILISKIVEYVQLYYFHMPGGCSAHIPVCIPFPTYFYPLIWSIHSTQDVDMRFVCRTGIGRKIQRRYGIEVSGDLELRNSAELWLLWRYYATSREVDWNNMDSSF